MITRRQLIANSIKTGLSATAIAAFPASIQKALAIPANNRTGTIKDVEHVVILMQENRSFDHYFAATMKNPVSAAPRSPHSRGTGMEPVSGRQASVRGVTEVNP